MLVNADFSKRVVVRSSETEWVPSLMPGVERKMLDRIGAEVARATTIVRFAPDSAFSEHTHDGGEEFLVLDGVFSDENGDFPAGSYIRNPPTSHHTPHTREGCTILVKLHQFDPADRTHIVIDTNAEGRAPDDSGISALALFEDTREEVRLETYAAGAAVSIPAEGGLEAFVVEGRITSDGDRLTRWDWLRLPVGATFNAVAGPDGARIWIKTGHLKHAPTAE